MLAPGRRRTCCALAALTLALVAARARAAELHVSAHENCVDAAAIRAQVEAQIERPLAGVEHADFDVAIVQRAAGDFLLTLRIVPRDGGAEAPTRQLLGASCAEARDAAAVAIALAITSREPEPEPAAEAPPPPAIAAAPAPSPPPAPQPPPAAEASPWRVSALLGVALDGAILPALAPGVQLELALGLHALALRGYGAWFLPQEASLPVDSGRAQFQLLAFGALACGEHAFGRVGALLCAGAELAALSGEGLVDRPEQGSALFAALRADLGAGYTLQPGLSLLARAGIAAPLSRREFQINRGTRLHQPAAVSARISLGAQLEF